MTMTNPTDGDSFAASDLMPELAFLDSTRLTATPATDAEMAKWADYDPHGGVIDRLNAATMELVTGIDDGHFDELVFDGIVTLDA